MPPTLRKNIQSEQRNTADHNQVFFHREQVTIANINLGTYQLLPVAPKGYKYRICDMAMIAIGGAAGATTTVDILGTVAAAAVKLLAVAIAALTQNALVRAGAANATILAGGASYVEMDIETAILASKTGAALTTVTHIEFQITYVLVPARSGA